MRLGLKAALLAGAAVVVGCAWTAGASAVFLWGTGLVRYFPFQGTAWIGQWWSYALFASPHPIVGRWLMFGAGAQRVPLTTMAFLQYLTPTMQFLIGVLLRHEPLGLAKLLGFGLVWVALVLFSVDLARHARRPAGLTLEPA